MGMDVVTGVNAVVVIHGCGFGDVPAEGVADRSRKGKTIVKQHIPDVATYQRHPLELCHPLMIWEIVAEPKAENERLSVVEHPSIVQLQFAAPTVIILVFEVGNLGFGISVEDLSTDIHAPPAKKRTVVGSV